MPAPGGVDWRYGLSAPSRPRQSIADDFRHDRDGPIPSPKRLVDVTNPGGARVYRRSKSHRGRYVDTTRPAKVSPETLHVEPAA